MKNNYAGLLYYDDADSDHLDVSDFIVRDDAVSFSFDSVSAKYGRWNTAGLAKKNLDQTYGPDQVVANQCGVKADAWNIEFKVEALGDTLFVEGVITADGNSHPFSGDLERKTEVR